MIIRGKLAVSHLHLYRNRVEQVHTVPGPEEVGGQVEAQGASSLEVSVGHLALLPMLVRRTMVLY